MFRNHRVRFTMFLAGLVALVTGLGFAAATAAGASVAGGQPVPCPTVTIVNGANGGGPGPAPGPGSHCPTPTPTPTITQTPPPPPVPRVHLVQEDFDLNIGGLVNPSGAEILATGDFAADLGTDTSDSPVLDVFSNTHGSVDAHHPALSGAEVNPITCTITVQQNDMPWYFLGGTGAYRHLRGTGFYTLRALISFPTKDFRCPALDGMSNWQADRDLNTPNLGGLRPSAAEFDVQGTGVTFFTSSHKVWSNPYSIMNGALTH